MTDTTDSEADDAGSDATGDVASGAAGSATGEAAGDGPRTTENEATGDDSVRGAGRNYRRYLNYAVLAGLLLLGFVAAIQLYLAGTDLIRTWIEPEYRPAFRAAFNLAVLLLAAVGISYQLNRLRD
jgi:hypothetical protein